MPVDAEVEGLPVIGGSVDFPLSWLWSADLMVDCGDKQPPEVGISVTLRLYASSMRGTVVASENPHGRGILRLVGGMNRLERVLSPRDYVGRSLSEIVSDVLVEAGETPGDLSNLLGVNMQHCLTAAEPAQRVLRRLLRFAPSGTLLRVDDSGKVAAFTPDWSVQLSLGVDDVEARLPSDEGVVLLTESGDIRPGVGVQIRVSDDLTITRKIDHVTYDFVEGGPTRTTLWFGIE